MIIGMILILVVFIITGLYSKSMVKSTSDFFAESNKAGISIVAGTILGTLVGGSSTIGTAQLAVSYGISGIWFTLGASIGCVLLALFFSYRLRSQNCLTIQQLLINHYGKTAGILASVLGSAGIFLNIIAQLLAATALINTVTRISPETCTIISSLLMVIYVVFGGIRSIGMIGIYKMLVLFVLCLVVGVISIIMMGGIKAFYTAVPHEFYFNLFARGVGVDVGAGLSMILGVLSTQTYMQAVISAKNDKTARNGALLSAFIIPIIGLCSVIIGIYIHINNPTVDAAQAFPYFVIHNTQPLLAGIILATLLITIVGTGAGLSLGISTILKNDLYPIFFNGRLINAISVTRFTIIGIIAMAAVFTLGDLHSYILKWSFLSMGLRAAVVFMPMCSLLFSKRMIKRVYAITAIVIGPFAIIITQILFKPCFDALFIGIITAFFIMFLGWLFAENGL